MRRGPAAATKDEGAAVLPEAGSRGTAEDGSRPVPRRLLRLVVGPFDEVVEAPRSDGVSRSYRRRLLFLLTLVIALDFADRAAVGALAPELKRAFDVSNTQIGLLASAFSIVGAVMTLPAGMLVDRVRRTALLAASIALWTLAMGATGAAVTFSALIGARVFLGLVTAAARPATASLTGDVFASRVRGRALGVIDSGELVGNGVGFLLSGVLAVAVSWRGVFWLLGALGGVLAWFVWRLEEPPRCSADDGAEAGPRDVVQRLAESADDVEAEADLVLRGDQARMPLGEAVRYVLRVRTNVIVLVSAAIGSFFFAGLRTFAIVFIVKAFGTGHGIADVSLLVVGIGALIGVLAGGRIGDRLIRGGRLNGRLLVASYSYLFAAAAFVPAFLAPTLPIALPLAFVGAAGLAAPAAPLDAVRLDVIHPQLWGRAEGVRNVAQIAAEAGGPLLFGLLSDRLDGGGGHGLRLAFLISLGALLVAALTLQLGRRFYPEEVAAAARGATAQ